MFFSRISRLQIIYHIKFNPETVFSIFFSFGNFFISFLTNWDQVPIMAIFASISYVATSNDSIALVLILVLVNTTYLTFLLDGQFILDFQNDNQVPPQAGAYIKVSLALYIFAYSKPSLALLIIAVCFLTFFLFYFHYLGNL